MLAVFCIAGCDKIDENVFLSVQMENNWQDHEENSAKYKDTGLKIFINGNYCQFLGFGSYAGPVDKFLRPGRNTLELKGSTAFPVEITVCSFKSDHTPIRTILNRKWPAISTDDSIQASFKVTKASLLPIFDKKNVLPERQKSDQELTSVVSNLYHICIAGNKEEFLVLTLAGYKIYSPSEYESVRNSVGPMFDGFDLKPYPERLHFIYGANLVFVYSGSDMKLFEARSDKSCSVSGMHFAYIENQWISW